jgi:hypothetical protein
MIYPTYQQEQGENFQAYIDRLMKVKPQFGGAFATPQQQGQDATSNATGGLLTGITANGGGNGGGQDFGLSEGAPSLRGNGPTGLTSADVDRARASADFFNANGKAVAQVGSALLGGPIGMLAGLAAPLANWHHQNVSRDYFADLQGRIDSTPLTSTGGYDFAAAGVNPAFGANHAYYGDVGYDGTANSFTPTGDSGGGGWTDAGGGSFDYGADTGYDR